MVIHNTVELANQVGLECKGDGEELLQSHGKSLSNEELPELAEQHIQSEFMASDAEEETPVRELSAEFLTNSITMIMQIMDQATDIDPNYEWRSMAWRGDLEMICCY